MASEKSQDGRETALVPLEQRHIEIEGEDVLAAWTGQHDVYVPLTPICTLRQRLGDIFRSHR